MNSNVRSLENFDKNFSSKMENTLEKGDISSFQNVSIKYLSGYNEDY